MSAIFYANFYTTGVPKRQFFQSLSGIISVVIILIVYADVLIFLNTIVNYFLLLATAKLSAANAPPLRLALASFVGGVACLYIFLPRQAVWAEFLYKIVVACIICVIGFRWQGAKQFLKSGAILFVITCAYGGVMFALWMLFKPYGMVINNSVVYFNISPTVLVLCTGGGYILFSVLWRIFGKSAKRAERCNVTVFADGKSIELIAIADTGNSIEDAFAGREVIIAQKGRVEALLGDTDFKCNSALRRRYQVLPCSTVTGYSTLDAFRCDSAEITCDDKKITLTKPLLAVARVNLDDDYNAIINPKILR